MNNVNEWTFSIKPEVDFVTGDITLREIINGAQNEFMAQVLKTKELAVRKSLIALGWTPPEVEEVPPTKWAYDAACTALWKHRAENEKMRQTLKFYDDLISDCPAGYSSLQYAQEFRVMVKQILANSDAVETSEKSENLQEPKHDNDKNHDV